MIILNILIDLNHPAQYYIFKYFIPEMKNKGHNIFISARKKDILVELLNIEGIDYHLLSSQDYGIIGNARELLKHEIRMYKLVRKNSIDIIIGSSVAGPHVSNITKAKSIFLSEDDRNTYELVPKIVFPFADYILTPDSLKENNGKKHIKYPSYHELAYLHPDVFKPNGEILTKYGISTDEKYCILRFSAFKAHHDKRGYGISNDIKKEIIRTMEDYGNVYITSEIKNDPLSKNYHIKIPINMIHNLLYYSSLYLGDSQSMAMESAMLGIPTIRCNGFVGTVEVSVINELRDRYGLIVDVPMKNADTLPKLVEDMLKSNSKDKWKRKRDIMLHDKINLNNYLQDFVNKVYNEHNKGR